MVLQWCLFAYVFVYGEPTERDSRAVLQNPSCVLLDVDDTMCRSNADSLTSGLEHQREQQQSSKTTSKDQKMQYEKYRKCLR